MTQKNPICLTVKERTMTAEEKADKILMEYWRDVNGRNYIDFDDAVELVTDLIKQLQEANKRIKELEKEVKSLNQILLDTEF